MIDGQGQNYSMQNQSLTMTNYGYEAASALQIRLDTDKLLQQIEMFLKGEQYGMRVLKNGDTVVEKQKISVRRCNEVGVQQLMAMISGVINPQVVQGNFSEDQYSNFIYNFNLDILEVIHMNMYEWGISENDLIPIEMFVMNLVEPFMSRLIGNKERDSYGQSLKAIETNAVREKGGINPFNR